MQAKNGDAGDGQRYDVRYLACRRRRLRPENLKLSRLPGEPRRREVSS